MIEKYVGRNFIWGGDGKLGFDCATLSKAVVEEAFNIEIHSEFLTSKVLEDLKTNNKLLIEQLDKLFLKISDGLGAKTQLPEMKMYDILVFRFLRIDCHLGIYIGDGKFISILEQQPSDIFSLHGVWRKRLSKIYRYEE